MREGNCMMTQKDEAAVRKFIRLLSNTIEVKKAKTILRENKILVQRCSTLSVNDRCLRLAVQSLQQDLKILQEINQKQRQDFSELKKYAADLKKLLDERIGKSFEGTIVKKL